MADDRPSDAFRATRVYGPSLDPQKTWILLTKELCGSRPRYFAKNYIFTRFSGEIIYVSRKELCVWRNGAKHPLQVGQMDGNAVYLKQPPNVYVTSPFGLFAGILRSLIEWV